MHPATFPHSYNNFRNLHTKCVIIEMEVSLTSNCQWQSLTCQFTLSYFLCTDGSNAQNVTIITASHTVGLGKTVLVISNHRSIFSTIYEQMFNCNSLIMTYILEINTIHQIQWKIYLLLMI